MAVSGRIIVSGYMILFFAWNIIVMLIYGLDKMKAKRGRRRISEATLLLCAAFFGGCGAMFGMILFNHKTSKIKFRILIPFMIVAEAVVIYLLAGSVK